MGQLKIRFSEQIDTPACGAKYLFESRNNPGSSPTSVTVHEPSRRAQTSTSEDEWLVSGQTLLDQNQCCATAPICKQYENIARFFKLIHEGGG